MPPPSAPVPWRRRADPRGTLHHTSTNRRTLRRFCRFTPAVFVIDSHAHLAGERFDTDRAAMLERAWAAGVQHVVVIGDLTDAPRELACTDAVRLSFTAGVHPHEAESFRGPADVLRIRELVAAGAVAIGECGLDYHYEFSPRARQREAFGSQLTLAAELRRPVVVHTRDAEEDTIAMMQSAAASGVQGVLHCFTGTPHLADAAITVGWMISISGIATFRNWDRDDVIRAVPEHLLLVETDAPYLAPVPNRGKRNEPAFLSSTIEHVAAVRGVTPAHVAAQTATNARVFFRLPPALLPA
jgi:TatD DNase family protein